MRYDSYSAFNLIASAMLPAGDGSVVAFSNVYFDESGTHNGSRIMSMAGYWFDAEQARKFSRDWAKKLKKYGITAAHQTDCALGYGEFHNIPKEQRVEIQKSLIENIKRRSKFSIAVAINPTNYNEIFSNIREAPSCYTFLLLLCVNKIAEEVRFRRYDGKIAYFFEAGHANASEANKFMNAIPKYGRNGGEGFGYAGHAFVEKAYALPLQAADMLAWQVRHFFERALDGHERPRKDYKALMRKQDLITVVSEDHLLVLQQFYRNIESIFGKSLYDPNVKIPGLDLAEGIARSFGLSLDTARRVREMLAQQNY